MSILYPIAASAEEALHAPKGFAAREREAADASGGMARFVSEAVGPAFSTREALTEAFSTFAAQPWCAVRPVAEAGKAAKAAVKPQNADGRRWPEPKAATPVLWRLSISYWRIGGAEEVPVDPARRLRRDPDAKALDAKALRALARQPLRAMKPQQPLDIGLFEFRPPDAPHIVMPDE
jgi:hypothetical protein